MQIIGRREATTACLGKSTVFERLIAVAGAYARRAERPV
jgi:hypothetical protein